MGLECLLGVSRDFKGVGIREFAFELPFNGGIGGQRQLPWDERREPGNTQLLGWVPW